ncbi:MAG: zinc ribbon domain-containing protein [Clostridia bacterium]|nr:zinc ribbon domain-containing protein [Clostridia bacterium]
MGFLDEIKDKVSEAANITGKKAGEMYETTKVKLEISELNSAAKNIYKEIGELVYAAHSNGEDNDAELEEKFAAIDEIREKLAELDERQIKIKNLKICPQCGATVPDDSSFCPKCGAKTEE